LSRRNPLIALKPTGSAYLAIEQPAPNEIFEHLVRTGKPAHLRLPKANGTQANLKPGELVTGETERERLLRVLTNLHRRALADFRERGLHILYLALGVLQWRDADEEPARSPPLLLAVDLRRKVLRYAFVLHA